MRHEPNVRTQWAIAPFNHSLFAFEATEPAFSQYIRVMADPNTNTGRDPGGTAIVDPVDMNLLREAINEYFGEESLAVAA